MARRKDAEEDPPSKAILDQLQTKTVGAPPSSTGLTGDQLPETIFDVDDFNTVKNQVTLQLSNLELLNVLNTIGQVTNTQSQSGPIPGTAEVIRTEANVSSADFTSKNPDHGTAVQIVGIGANANTTLASLSGITLYVKLIDDVNSTECTVIEWQDSGSIGPADNQIGFPIIVDHNITVKVRAFKSGGFSAGEAVLFDLAYIRVR